MGEVSRIALAARVFALAALIPLAAVAGPRYLHGAGLVLLTAAAAALLTHRSTIAAWAVACAEGAVVSLMTVLTHPDDTIVMPYLVVPAMIAGLDLGRRGLQRVLVAEYATLALAWFTWVHALDRAFAVMAVTWLVCAIGTGLLGVALRRAITTSGPEAGYRDALDLVRRLDVLAGRLHGGLDTVAIADQVLGTAHHALDVGSGALLVGSPTGPPTPLRLTPGAHAASLSWGDALADRAWRSARVVTEGTHVAVPLTSAGEVVGLVLLDALSPPGPEALRALQRDVTPFAVPLQAALVFDRVRERATSQERQRIAREVHDGVAQDVASLGYLVDAVAGGAESIEQANRISVLRSEVSRIVGELRHSIFDLRQEMPAGAGLGESLAAYAQAVASTSGMTVHVTVDEQGPRLPQEVAFELYRIGQEAMANARRHSGGSTLWLRCTVDSPHAEIEVRDDGTRRHDPRPDSHGLSIMRERAIGIGAELDVRPPTADEPGTRVTVTLGRRPDRALPAPPLARGWR